MSFYNYFLCEKFRFAPFLHFGRRATLLLCTICMWKHRSAGGALLCARIRDKSARTCCGLVSTVHPEHQLGLISASLANSAFPLLFSPFPITTLSHCLSISGIMRVISIWMAVSVATPQIDKYTQTGH